MLDLFGQLVTEPWPVPLGVKEPRPKGRRKKRKDPKPRGYARIPGTGPKGESCRTCDHAVRFRLSSKCIYKCVCNYPRWTKGRGSDIVLKSPACLLWTMKWKRTPPTEESHDPMYWTRNRELRQAIEDSRRQWRREQRQARVRGRDWERRNAAGMPFIDRL